MDFNFELVWSWILVIPALLSKFMLSWLSVRVLYVRVCVSKGISSKDVDVNRVIKDELWKPMVATKLLNSRMNVNIAILFFWVFRSTILKP